MKKATKPDLHLVVDNSSDRMGADAAMADAAAEAQARMFGADGE